MDQLNDGTAATRRASGSPMKTGRFTPALPARAVRRFPVGWLDKSRRRNPDGKPAASQTLLPGQAVKWIAPGLGVLRITHGRLWATRTGAGPHHPESRGGDHFLDAGDLLTLSVGDEWLLEAWPASQGGAAVFNWTPRAPLSAAVPVNWRADVLAPLDELRLALQQAARSALHVAAGLARALIATINVADYARIKRARCRFDTQTCHSPTH